MTLLWVITPKIGMGKCSDSAVWSTPTIRLENNFGVWEKKCFARVSNRPNRRLASFFGQCKTVDMRDLGP